MKQYKNTTQHYKDISIDIYNLSFFTPYCDKNNLKK